MCSFSLFSLVCSSPSYLSSLSFLLSPFYLSFLYPPCRFMFFSLSLSIFLFPFSSFHFRPFFIFCSFTLSPFFTLSCSTISLSLSLPLKKEWGIWVKGGGGLKQGVLREDRKNRRKTLSIPFSLSPMVSSLVWTYTSCVHETEGLCGVNVHHAHIHTHAGRRWVNTDSHAMEQKCGSNNTHSHNSSTETVRKSQLILFFHLSKLSVTSQLEKSRQPPPD